MKKIPFKNYLLLFLIIGVTVVLTFFISNIYKERKRVVSDFYEYSNTISVKEFDSYVTEYPNSIIYIYDKYSYDFKDFEEELRKLIDEKYLKNNLVYIDKRELSKKFISEIKENYNADLKYNDYPLIIIISEKEIINIIEINEDTDISIVNLGVFE